MNWREWFENLSHGYYQIGECKLTEETRYQAFVERWNEEEYPKIKARLIEELKVELNCGLEGAIKDAMVMGQGFIKDGKHVPIEEITKTNWREKMDRECILLKAAYDILKKCDDGPYVKNVLEETVFYDEVECDGACLMEDIGYLLKEKGILEEKDEI